MSDEITPSFAVPSQQPSIFNLSAPNVSTPVLAANTTFRLGVPHFTGTSSVPFAPITNTSPNNFVFGTSSPPTTTVSLQSTTFDFSTPKALATPPPCSTVTPSPTTTLEGVTSSSTGFFGIPTPFQHGSTSVPPANGYNTGTTPPFGGKATSTFVFGSPPAPSSGIGGHDGFVSSANSVTSTGCCKGTCIFPYQLTTALSGTESAYLTSITAMEAYEDWSFEELRFADFRQGSSGTTAHVPEIAGLVEAPVSASPKAATMTNAAATQLISSETKNTESIEIKVEDHDPYVPVFERTSSELPKITMKTIVVDIECMLKLVCWNLVRVPSVEVTFRCEGTSSKLFLILVSTKEELFIFDCIALDVRKVCEELKPLLDHRGILKMIHDSHNTAAQLKTFGNIREIQCVYDTQITAEAITAEWNAGFSEMLDASDVPNNINKSVWEQKTPDALEQRPLKAHLKQSLLDEACKMHEAFEEHMTHFLNQSTFSTILKASFERVKNAANTGGKRSLCFCTQHDGEYKMMSYEWMQRILPSRVIKPSPTVALNDSAQLLGLLPEDIAMWIRDRADDLFEIVLDKGRPPTAWIGQERVMIGGNDTTRIVTESDIRCVTTKLNKFGPDNRAGLEKQLHRISAIRNRSNEIIGLTMRVGRHVSGNAYIITDLLHGHPNSSILFLGEPGSGKTTVVREVTRLLAERHNVCIVDTSNEIAGDGDVPHPCVGHARRLMVQKSDAQSDVMIECVQNHTPDVIVIDEIGRPNEVDAARTCKNRGVRLIASAHGDLRQLVKNPKLRGLVGGIDRVIVGDEEARKRARNFLGKPIQKTKSERAGSPTFEIIVELKRGAPHEWTIILDAGDAVDKILYGDKYPVQRRTQNPNTGTFHLVHDQA